MKKPGPANLADSRHFGAEHQIRTGDLRLGNETARHARGSSTILYDPLNLLGSSGSAEGSGSTSLHAGSRASCAQDVPGPRTPAGEASLDVGQVAALLGCSTAHVYKLCEDGKLPHYRTATNAVRFACGVLGRTLRLAVRPRDIDSANAPMMHFSHTRTRLT